MTVHKTESIKLTDKLLTDWANDPKGPVALNLKQRLVSVDTEMNETSIVYPPTYAKEGTNEKGGRYVIDTLPDGSKVALIDSVGSQANRLESIFKSDNPEEALVPQLTIELNVNAREDGPDSISLLDLAHRAADAVVQASPELHREIEEAFASLHKTGDAAKLCALAPTSLVFGVWDSRGGSGEKRPRLVRSVIRAWDVQELTSASQFNSVWKKLSDKSKNELEKEAKAKKKKLSKVGLNDAPASGLGGIAVNGRVERIVTVNLTALRALRGTDEQGTQKLREYLLGLALIAATNDIDLYLREGCHLRYAGEDQWYAVPRRGPELTEVDLTSEGAQSVLGNFASEACKYFRPRWPSKLNYQFDLKEAKKLLSKEVDENE